MLYSWSTELMDISMDKSGKPECPDPAGGGDSLQSTETLYPARVDSSASSLCLRSLARSGARSHEAAGRDVARGAKITPCGGPDREQTMRFDRITFDPKIMGGRACIRGMRIPVSVIVGQIAHGASTDEVLDDYPDLEAADIRQALEYAAWLTQEQVIPA